MRQIVERTQELDEIDALLHAASSGRGRVLAVEGTAGIGKTTLLAVAGERASARGFTVLQARGAPLEQAFPFGVLRQLLDPILMRQTESERTALLSGPAAAAADVLLATGTAPSTADELARTTFPAVQWVAGTLARDRPVLLIIDDLQWCDALSVRLLQFLAPRLAEQSVAVLASRRTADENPLGAIVDDLLGEASVDVVRPSRLSRHGVAALVEESLGRPDEQFVSGCYEVTAGVPLLVRELLRAARDEALRPVAAHVTRLHALGSDLLGATLASRLDRLGPDAGRVARAVTVLGDGAEPSIVASLAGIDEASAARSGASLIRAGVFADAVPLRFSHPLLRSSLEARWTEAERAYAHAEAARVLRRAHGDPARIAEHLVRAPGYDDAESGEVLVVAAEQVLASGAPEAAVRYAERALAGPADDALRAAALRVLGISRMRLFQPAEAERHLRAALPLVSGSDRVEVVRALGVTLTELHRSVEATRLLQDLLEDPQTVLSDEERLAMEADLVALSNMHPATAPDVRTLLERHASLAGRTVVERRLLASLARRWQLDNRPVEVCAEVARRALRDPLIVGESGLGLPIWAAAVNVLTACDDVDAAEAALEGGLRDAEEHGATVEVAAARAYRAQYRARIGQLRLAHEDARASYDVFGPFLATFPLPAAVLVDVLVDRGGLQEADEAMSTVLAYGPITETSFAPALVYSRARLRLARGDVSGAVDDLRDVGRRLAQWSSSTPTLYPWRSLLAVVLPPDSPERRPLVDEELQLAHASGSARAIGVAQRAAGLVRGRDGIDVLREAVQHLAEAPAPVEQARALVALGGALRRAGERRAARTPLQSALELAAECGADAVAQDARQELRAMGARPDAPQHLTPMEARIAELVVTGATNAEIAARLFVTVKNVEAHLTRAYRKLGITSRAQLRQALAGQVARDRQARPGPDL